MNKVIANDELGNIKNFEFRHYHNREMSERCAQCDIDRLVAEVTQLRYKSETDDEEIATLKRIVIARNADITRFIGESALNKDYPCPRCDLVASNLAAYSAHANEQGHWGYSHAEMTALRREVKRLQTENDNLRALNEHLLPPGEDLAE